MWCTELNNTHLENVSKLDETVQVRGCLGRLLQPNKSRKRQGEKLSVQTTAPPVCMAKPSVVVLPSPQQNQNYGKTKRDIVPTTSIQLNRDNSDRSNRPRNKSKQSSIRGMILDSSTLPQQLGITSQTRDNLQIFLSSSNLLSWASHLKLFFMFIYIQVTLDWDFTLMET